MNDMKRKITGIAYDIRHVFCYGLSILRPKRYVFVKCWVKFRDGKLKHNNFGDELNAYLIRFLTKKKVILLPPCKAEERFPIRSYLVIGSVLQMFNLDRTVLWGPGLINGSYAGRIHGTPEAVHAVRGPKTREALLKKGIDCPEVYGDPALLLPKFYQPMPGRRFRMGVIPHYIDQEKEDVKRITQNPDVCLIRMRGYETWTDVIDQICSCDFIISSSLHGLIISEAYGIPSRWVEFGEYIDGWQFKFFDFYGSIGKKNELPFVIDEATDMEELSAQKDLYRPAVIDTDRLLDACPIR